MFFDRVFFRRPSSNNSDVNEIAVDTANAFDCCVKCQSAVRPFPYPPHQTKHKHKCTLSPS